MYIEVYFDHRSMFIFNVSHTWHLNKTVYPSLALHVSPTTHWWLKALWFHCSWFICDLSTLLFYLFNFIASLYLFPIGLTEIQVTLVSFKNIFVQISLVSTLFSRIQGQTRRQKRLMHSDLVYTSNLKPETHSCAACKIAYAIAVMIHWYIAVMIHWYLGVQQCFGVIYHELTTLKAGSHYGGR